MNLKKNVIGWNWPYSQVIFVLMCMGYMVLSEIFYTWPGGEWLGWFW